MNKAMLALALGSLLIGAAGVTLALVNSGRLDRAELATKELANDTSSKNVDLASRSTTLEQKTTELEVRLIELESRARKGREAETARTEERSRLELDPASFIVSETVDISDRGILNTYGCGYSETTRRWAFCAGGAGFGVTLRGLRPA